ncbi:MAG: hypothetical protein IJ530_00970 [Treponema sp.]|uniref:hypothetical protein n=1 Tax=Treponema sp. TaxID=166 RepID=UPI0025D32962|nr:hypothetical protein [Treponema sp.]MBQ8678316.1 hypothetical protein [Treponema sp.]
MTEQNLSSTLHTLGFIEAISRFAGNAQRCKKDVSTEDYVGKITAVFSPYLAENMSESRFIGIQGEVKKIVCEIRGQK